MIWWILRGDGKGGVASRRYRSKDPTTASISPSPGGRTSILAGTTLDHPYASRRIPDLHCMSVDELHGLRDGFDIAFGLELLGRSKDVARFVNWEGSIDRHCYLGDRNPGELAHSLMCAAVSARRAFLMSSSRSGPDDSIALSRASSANASRRPFRAAVSLNRRRSCILGTMVPKFAEGSPFICSCTGNCLRIAPGTQKVPMTKEPLNQSLERKSRHRTDKIDEGQKIVQIMKTLDQR